MACGGGGAKAPVNTSPFVGSAFAQSTDDTLAARASLAHSTTTITADTATLRVDYSDASVARTPGETATLRFDVSKAGILTLNLRTLGETADFSLGNLSAGIPSQLETNNKNGKQIYLWTFEDGWQDVIDGSMPFRFHTSFGTSTFDPDTLINDRAYGVIGLQTPVSELSSKPTTTYSGVLRMDSFLLADPDFLFQIFGDVSIVADFDAGSVSGEIENMIVGDLPQSSSLLIHRGNLSGRTYHSTVGYDPSTCGSGGCGAITASALSGEFFGNAGQETGGTLVFEGVSSDGHGYVAAGAFEAAE